MDLGQTARLLAAGLSTVLWIAGCAGGPAQEPATGINASYNSDTGRLERITYDRNRDGNVDATAVMNGTRILRAELDEDFDGKVDRWEFYADQETTTRTGGTEALQGVGMLERVEQATGASGKVSRWETYEGGVLRHAEEDTDGNGQVDKWETWSNGSLTALALDTTGAGRPDRRLVYPSDGGEPRLELADAAGNLPGPPSTR